MTRIGILLFDQVEELDAVGPWEVFGVWAKLHPDEAEVVAFAREAGAVRASKGLTLHADTTIDVRREERFVDDGDVVTSSGVSAGIDMALHLVARLAGADRAREVRRHMQYDPEPPV